AHAVEEALGDQFPIPREAEEPVRVQLIGERGEVIPYEMSRPLSGRAVLKLERLSELANPGDLDEWVFKGTPVYVTTAAKVDAAIRSAAVRGETLYVPR